jgi:hypothetical protein
MARRLTTARCIVAYDIGAAPHERGCFVTGPVRREEIGTIGALPVYEGL